MEDMLEIYDPFLLFVFLTGETLELVECATTEL